MCRIIDDFLDLAMIESGRFEVNAAPADIRAPLEKSMALNRMAARKKGLTLEPVVNGVLPVIRIDSPKIEQVFNNLIGNAIEHSKTGTSVTVGLAVAGDQLLVEVADSGPGLADDEIHRLFAPYARGRAGKGPGVKRTGLGLAISKKIIEAHNGQIGVKNRPEGGAVFYFALPIRE
jgi:signal transduction histidine kinase